MSERGPCVAGVSIKRVRAVSIGERMSAERDDETKDRINVVKGEGAVNISADKDEVMSSSGRPAMAESRLRMKVFNVGRSSE